MVLADPTVQVTAVFAATRTDLAGCPAASFEMGPSVLAFDPVGDALHVGRFARAGRVDVCGYRHLGLGIIVQVSIGRGKRAMDGAVT